MSGLDYSYISRIEKGYMPSQEAVIKLARALNLPDKELLNLAGYAPKIDLLNVLEDKYAEITAAGQALTQQQRMSIIHAIEKADHPDTPGDCVPHIGNIRAGIPLLSEQNIIGYIDIPENLASKADFALSVRGDSMIGAGISDNDVVVCKEGNDALTGQIVVALVNGDETTLKYYIQDNGRVVLRAANPEFKDIELKPGDIIQGHVIKILKDPPPVSLYREFIYCKEAHQQEWNKVIESAVAYGITPSAVQELVLMQVELAKKLAGKRE
ncbi:MAG: helix-turn-helix domain-containing protein [Pelotomaculum sp.]